MNEKIQKLNDLILEGVSGGTELGSENNNNEENTTIAMCNYCKVNRVFDLFSGSQGKCRKCGNTQTI